MRGGVITFVAILLAIVGWWGVYDLTGKIAPDQPGALSLFYALLFMAATATLMPPLAYLNRRFAPEATELDPWRFFRQSAWGGICVAVWAWLQMNRAFHAGFALVSILIFVAIEVLITRLRTGSEGG